MEPEEIFVAIFGVVFLVFGAVISVTGIVYTCTRPEREVVNVTTFEQEFYDTESNKTFVVTVAVNERKN